MMPSAPTTRKKLDTNAFHPDHRLDFWKEIVCKVYVELDCVSDVNDFSGSIDVHENNSITYSCMRARSQRVDRSMRSIRQGRGDYFVVALARSGINTIVQDDREATIATNAFSIYDTTRPYSLYFPEDFEQVILKIPRRLLLERTGPLTDLCAICFDARTPLSKLTFDFTSNIAAILDKADPETARNLLLQAVDLLSMDIGERLYDRGRVDTNYKSALRFRMKAIIRSNIRDPDLDVNRVAASMSVSPRYIRALLAEEGTSFGRYILSERLDRCRADLGMRSRSHQRISDIAYNWGFKDCAYFSRKFRERFGISPRDQRQIAANAMIKSMP